MENDENKAWIEIIAFDTRTREVKILGSVDDKDAAYIKEEICENKE